MHENIERTNSGKGIGMDKELLLYNYFSNQLTAEQERAFNDLLDTDADFKAQFLFEKDLQQAIRKKENQELKSKLQGFEKNIQAKSAVPRTNARFRPWSVAASITMLIAIGWFAYTSLLGTSNQDLYDAYFEPYPNTVYTITRSDGNQTLERAAFVAYESQDDDRAAELFLEAGATIAHGNFYLAQVLLRLNRNEEAIELLAQSILEDSTFEAEANWYLALAYLKENDTESATEVLERQVSQYDFKKVKAQELLDSLR